MNTWSWMFDAPFSTRLAMTLLHVLWQGSCLGLFAFAADGILKSVSPRFRYAMNVVVLLLMAACLPVTFCLLEIPRSALPSVWSDQNPEAPQFATHIPGSLTPDPAALMIPSSRSLPESQGSVAEWGTKPNTGRMPVSDMIAIQSVNRSKKPSDAQPANTVLLEISRCVVAIYLIGVALVLGRLITGLSGGQRLRKMSSAVTDHELLNTVQTLAARLGIKVAPTIAWCGQISVPVVVGIVKPMILLPLTVVSGLTAAQLQALLLHELAHIRRFDPIVNLLQRIVEAILFFHPAVWFISRRISIEREHAADDLVLASGLQRPQYADALVRVAELASMTASSNRLPSTAILGVFGTSPTEFKLRILRLLDDPSSQKFQFSRATAVIPILVVALGGIVAALQSDRSDSASPIAVHETNGEAAASERNSLPDSDTGSVNGGTRTGPAELESARKIAPNAKEQARHDEPPKDETAQTSPPKGLEFLTPYPQLHGLSLQMAEKEFRDFIERHDIKSRKISEGGKRRYRIPLGDGHTLIVMFRDDGNCAGMQRVRGEDPDPIRAVLNFDRNEFLLGESIVVEYGMTNTADSEASYGRGGFYPDLRINDGFQMSAVKVDENGRPLAGPVANWPMPENSGGKAGNFKLKPGEIYSTTLFVTRYLRFLEPGRYRLRIRNIDRLDPDTVYSTAEAYLTMKQPTQEEARGVFERMKQFPREAYDSNAMKFLRDAADFQAIHQPFYLPVLKEYATKGDLDAMQSLEQMNRLDSNEVLVSVMSSALDRDDWQTARVCFKHLKACMPFPNWYNVPLSDYDKPNRDRVARTWNPVFVPVLTRLAKRLNVEVGEIMRERERRPRNFDAKDPQFMDLFRRGMFPDEHPQSLLIDIDYIYRCLGRAEDFADCLTAFDHSIELTNTLPLETHQYFRPRGSAYGLRHTVRLLLERGAKAPIKPASPAEAAAYVMALRSQDNFRPEGWQAEIMKWLNSESSYLAELILELIPEPVPDAVLDFLPTALADDYVDLQIAACHMAKKHPRPSFREPLQRILDSAKDTYLRKYAVDAARANGLKAKYDSDAPFVDQDAEDR